MQRSQANSRICQVDLANTYDHKHQDLSPNNASKGLVANVSDITKVLIRKLATQGHCFGAETPAYNQGQLLFPIAPLRKKI